MAVIIGNGGVGERLKPAVLKTVRLERVSGVRIPPPPPLNQVVNHHFQSFRRPKSLSRFIRMQELPAQQSAKPLGSESFFDAVAFSRAPNWQIKFRFRRAL